MGDQLIHDIGTVKVGDDHVETVDDTDAMSPEDGAGLVAIGVDTNEDTPGRRGAHKQAATRGPSSSQWRACGVPVTLTNVHVSLR